MHEHQAAGAAEGSAALWYVARGDERYGPLTDRELLLLAERGGLKSDDLLWRSGFDGWKPVHAVGGAPAQDATGERDEGKRGLKARLYDELRKFLLIFAYLWLVFFVFLAHEWTVLASHNIGFRFYGLALVNALVLSKIMLIAEGLKFAEGLKDKPLVYPIVFKSVAFSVLLMLCYIAEEIAVGLFHGKSLAEAFPQIGGGGLAGVVTIGAIMCIALVPFFAFKEIARAIGEAEFRVLMFGPANAAGRSEIRAAPVLAPAE